MAYTDTLQIVRVSGIGVEVKNELLGTGDNSKKSFDLDYGNVISDSYTLKYSTSGDDENDFTDLTETTHYTIDKDGGSVLLTAAGVTALGTNQLYADYTYSPRHSDTLLNTYISPAEKEVEIDTANDWNTVSSSVQYFDGYTSGYPQTDEPFGEQIDPLNEFQLDNRNVATITSVQFMDRQGSVERNLDSTEYYIVTDDDGNDSRLVINTTIPNGKMNVKVTYTHGYTSVPDLVSELTALYAGLRALVNISGGSYKDASTYNINSESISIGQIYVNVRESIIQMRKRIDELILKLGGNYFCV